MMQINYPIMRIFKNLLLLAFIAAGVFISYALVVHATSKDDIVFPVAELGNCGSESECRAYCDEPAHYSACFAFAKKHNLLEGPLADKDERELEEFAAIIQKGGPGGCTSQSSCEAYCNNVNHIDECLAFGEKHDFLRGEELKEAKKIQRALAQGATLPGGCTSKDSCETYCSDASHMEECIAFAEAAGFMSKKELEEVKRILPLMQRGETPGGCTSKDACEAYCEIDAHFEECITFAEKAGFMKPEEAEIARKVGAFGGPGGCKSERECRAYCDEPTHHEDCFTFASEHGLIPEEDLRNIEEGRGKIKEALEQARQYPEVQECLHSTIGLEVLEKVANGEHLPQRDLGDHMRRCFDEFSPRPEFSESDMHMVPEQFFGSGGCSSEEECKMYCETHPEECGMNVQPSEGLRPDQFEQQYQEGLPQQFDEQHRQEYEEQYRQQFEQQYEEFQKLAPQSRVKPPKLGEFLLSLLAGLLLR